MSETATTHPLYDDRIGSKLAQLRSGLTALIDIRETDGQIAHLYGIVGPPDSAPVQLALITQLQHVMADLVGLTLPPSGLESGYAQQIKREHQRLVDNLRAVKAMEQAESFKREAARAVSFEWETEKVPELETIAQKLHGQNAIINRYSERTTKRYAGPRETDPAGDPNHP